MNDLLKRMIYLFCYLRAEHSLMYQFKVFNENDKIVLKYLWKDLYNNKDKYGNQYGSIEWFLTLPDKEINHYAIIKPSGYIIALDEYNKTYKFLGYD